MSQPCPDNLVRLGRGRVNECLRWGLGDERSALLTSRPKTFYVRHTVNNKTCHIVLTRIAALIQ